MTKLNLILLFLFLILLVNNIVKSQDIKLGGSCELIDINSKCASKLNYTSFYLQPGDSINELYKNVSDTIQTLELTNSDCKSNATYIFCLKSFPKCNTFQEKLNDNSTKSFNLPSLPCNSICMKAQIPCQYYIDNFFKELSCSSKFSNGQLMFPIESTQYNIIDNGNDNQVFNFTVQCSDSVIYSNETVEIKCPKPLLSTKEFLKPGKSLYYHISDDCILGCPFDIYPKNKMDLLNTTNYVLTSISFITCVFMILTFGVLPNKITHRMESILSFAIGGFFSSLSLFIQSSESNFSCSKDPGRFKSQSDSLCLLTGLIFQFGAITLILWSPMIAYDFYLTSVMKKITKFGGYRIILWVFAVILTAIPAFGGKYGATLASNCWITSDSNSAWQYVSFYIPSWISMAILVFFSIFSVVNVSKMYMQTPNNRILFFNIKIIFTIILFLFDLTFASSLKFYMEERMNDYFDAIAKWAICISSNENPDNCELNAPGYDLKALNIVVIAILGFTVFIGYGLDPISLQIWRESTKLRWILNKCKLNKVINVISKTVSGNNSTSTTGSDDHHHHHEEHNKRKQTNIGMSKLNNVETTNGE